MSIQGLLILLEAGCGFAWTLALWPALAAAPGLAWVALAATAGGGLTASLSRVVPPPVARMVWIAGGLLGPALVPWVVPGGGPFSGDGAGVAVMVLYLWWRGLAVAAGGPAHTAVGRHVGFVAAAAASLLVGRGWLGGPPRPVAGLLVPGVFLGGLAALGLAWRRERGLPSAWPALGSAFALLLGGLALARLAGAAVLAAGRLLGGWVLGVVQVVMGGVGAAFIFLLGPAVDWVAARLPARVTGSPESWYGAGPVTAEPLQPGDGAIPGVLLWVLGALGVLLLVAALAALARELPSRAGERLPRGQDEQRQAVTTAARRHRPRRRRPPPGRVAGHSPGETVRRVYRSVLALAAARGQGRLPAETPFECLPRLQVALPGVVGELETISRIYARCRYGETEPAPAELDRVLTAWRAVRREGDGG